MNRQLRKSPPLTPPQLNIPQLAPPVKVDDESSVDKDALVILRFASDMYNKAQKKKDTSDLIIKMCTKIQKRYPNDEVAQKLYNDIITETKSWGFDVDYINVFKYIQQKAMKNVHLDKK